MSYQEQQCKQVCQPPLVCPPRSAQSPVLCQSAPSLVLLQSAQSPIHCQSALSHAHLSHASRNALLCNLLHHASKSAHPRANKGFSSLQNQKKRTESILHKSIATPPSSI
ncbi:small proline-rich protein 2J [Mus musculus]|uniref:Putative small proline-rich protein 2J n=1 Tax=Mus musculus TaxID=10090 RepID=SPR2J_MOUSE|nr:RecName: Full=Putative small proline-rich protein 2J [Mus musculus]EDL00701.1 small proline-rich protein 2J [Mus musculus]BAB31532.1 unnamed protein product [Mus musculus]